MAKSRKSHRRGSRKAHRKAHRKGSRKAHRKGSRKQRGGVAPVGEYGAGSGITPMTLNLAQGQQFAAFHAGQHGGGNLSFGPYPGAVQEATVLPADLVASAKLLPLNQSFDYIRQFGPSSDNPNLKGGKRRRGRKGRKGSRKGSRKQRGGVLVRWGAGGGRRRNTRRNRRNRRPMYGGSRAEMNMPMNVGEETKMLISPQMQLQAGLNPECKLAENPASFDPIETKY
jgi:hypothetical protein